MGILIPAVHIQDNMQLKPGEYRISLKGNQVARGELVTGCLLAMDPVGGADPLDGMSTREPTYGLPAVWIKEKERQEAISKGYTVVDLPTVLITHLTDVVKRHAHELVGRQEVQQLLDTLKQSHPKVVEELVPNLLSLGGVVKVLQNLLKEQVPIRDLLTICETLADWASMTKDLDMLAEQVRQALSRTITGLYTVPGDKLKVITLDQKLERMIHEALQHSDQGSYLALEPRTAQKIMNALANHVEKFASRQLQPIVMCSGRIRPHLKRLFDRFVPNMVVLAYDEILNNVQIQSLAVMELNDADQAI
jgi:flagellar biosynthesis protein FlhA